MISVSHFSGEPCGYSLTVFFGSKQLFHCKQKLFELARISPKICNHGANPKTSGAPKLKGF